MSRDLTSAEGARAWIEALKEMAAAEFSQAATDNNLPPRAVLIITRDQHTGAKLAAPAVMFVAVASEVVNDHGGQGKDRLAIYLRRVARRTDAIGFAFLSEIWALENVDILPKGSWENVPGRREELMVAAQHKALGDGSWLHHAAITRPKKGRATLGPWQALDSIETNGRFADVLPSSVEDAAEADAFKAIFAAGSDIPPEDRRELIENVRRQMYESGMPRHVVDVAITVLTTRIREAGLEVPARLGDPAGPPANDGPTVIEVFNLSDEVSPPKEPS